jgi:hypothetical protein
VKQIEEKRKQSNPSLDESTEEPMPSLTNYISLIPHRIHYLLHHVLPSRENALFSPFWHHAFLIPLMVNLFVFDSSESPLLCFFLRKESCLKPISMQHSLLPSVADRVIVQNKVCYSGSNNYITPSLRRQ